MAADDMRALYALPLEEFTKARDDLAKAKRADGDREGAATVKALRKPSVPAWALNQVAHQNPELVTEVVRAGADVRKASELALSGDAADLRSASRDLTNAVHDLAEAAASMLRAAGKPPAPATIDRIVTTARAAATNEALGETLGAGVLQGDAEPAGFDLSGLAVVPVERSKDDDGTAAARQAEKQALEQDRERDKLDRDIERHAEKVERAEREVRELEARLAAALDRVDRLNDELQALRDARAELD